MTMLKKMLIAQKILERFGLNSGRLKIKISHKKNIISTKTWKAAVFGKTKGKRKPLLTNKGVKREMIINALMMFAKIGFFIFLGLIFV